MSSIAREVLHDPIHDIALADAAEVQLDPLAVEGHGARLGVEHDMLHAHALADLRQLFG